MFGIFKWFHRWKCMIWDNDTSSYFMKTKEGTWQSFASNLYFIQVLSLWLQFTGQCKAWFFSPSLCVICPSLYIYPCYIISSILLRELEWNLSGHTCKHQEQDAGALIFFFLKSLFTRLTTCSLIGAYWMSIVSRERGLWKYERIQCDGIWNVCRISSKKSRIKNKSPQCSGIHGWNQDWHWHPS